jgi:hypothetical protein
MEKKTSSIERSNETVCRLFIELNKSLYVRLTDASVEFEMSKRDIVSDALMLWLNDHQTSGRE